MERLNQMEDDSMYNRSEKGPGLPPLPPDAEPSELYKIVVRHSQYPPILQTDTWTQAVPFKEQRYHRTPSERIGNNYSPHVQDLKWSNLKQRKHTERKSSVRPGVASSTSAGRGQIIKVKRRGLTGVPRWRDLSTPISQPISPKEQMDILDEEETIKDTDPEPTKADIDRHYITEGVSSPDLTPQPPQQMMDIQRLLPDTGDVDSILTDPSEQEQLSIDNIPKPCARRVTHASVPWADSCEEVHTWLSKHLSIANPIMLSVQDTWMNNFSSLRVVQLQDLPSASLPLLPSEFEEFIQKQCQTTRDELIQKGLTGPPRLREFSTPISRPISPKEQMDIMDREEKIKDTDPEPTKADIDRYYRYITEGVSSSAITPLPPQQMMNIQRLLPDTGDSNAKLQIMKANLEKEVKRDYEFSLKMSIVDYILTDPSERERLSIESIPKPFARRVIRAPVPWADSYREVHTWLSKHLSTANPIMISLQDTWMNNFSSLRFVRLEDLFSASLPLLPSEFEEFIQKQCQTTRDELVQKWLPQCASVIYTYMKESKKGLPVTAHEFFSCVAALMSLHLRSLVLESLQDLLYFFTIHKDGNNFGDVYDELQYFQAQVLLIKVQLNESNMDFNPSFQECWQVIHGAFLEIIKSAKNLPRVDSDLYPGTENLYLRTVSPDETVVTDIINQAKDVFHKNTEGPPKYLNVYKKYSKLLDNTATRDITLFLKFEHSLEGFTKKMESVARLRREIASLPITVPLSMFCLYTEKLNEDLCARTDMLKDRVAMFKVEENRELNRRICQKYEDITVSIKITPKSTEEMMSFNRYIKETSEVTVCKLIDEIDEATDRLNFLMQHATLTSDDMKLNSRVFQWPTDILTELELSRTRVATMREQAEDVLQTRVSRLDESLKDVDKEIQGFKKKEYIVIDTESMKNNVENLKKITAKLDAAVIELKAINKELALLEREPSDFPALENLAEEKQPYEQLWTTALDFQSMSDVWMNGPFRNLDAEKVSKDLDVMRRTFYDLTKSLSNLPGPCHVAETFKQRVDQLKLYTPLLSTICKPTLKPQHWETISTIVGVPVKPNVNSSLQDMLDIGLFKFSDQLEEIIK